MNKTQALYEFFSSFGIPAYPDTAVPDTASMPYLTYTVLTGAWGDSSVSLTVKLWYYTESEAVPNAKAEEISKKLGRGGVQIICDEGVIWLLRGTPFCQAISFDSDNNVKGRYINIEANFHTIY